MRPWLGPATPKRTEPAPVAPPIGNLCFPTNPPLPSAFSVLVVAPQANPFLLDWAPPGQRRQGPIIVGSGYHDVTTPDIGMLQERGYSLHPGDQTNNPQQPGTWHHVSIAVKEFYPPLGTTLDQEGGIATGPIDALGNPASILKARIKLQMGNSRTRSFDFDIGAGVEFDVRCLAVHGIDVLVPNPAGAGATPEDLQPQLTALTTIVTTTVYCSPTKSHEKHPLTYSQSFLSIEGSNRFLMPVMPGARAAQLLITSGSIGAATELVFGFSPTNPITPTLAPTPPAAELGAVQVPTTESSSPVALIPGGANLLLVRSDAGSLQGTVVQILSE